MRGGARGMGAWRTSGIAPWTRRAGAMHTCIHAYMHTCEAQVVAGHDRESLARAGATYRVAHAGKRSAIMRHRRKRSTLVGYVPGDWWMASSSKVSQAKSVSIRAAPVTLS